MSALDVAIRLIELTLLGLVLWRVHSQPDPTDPDAPTPAHAAALEKRMAHLQNAVFHMNRRLDSVLKNAATEPAMRVGHGPRQDSPRPPRGGIHNAPTPFVGTPRPFGAFKDTERMSGEELERALVEAAEADSGPLPERVATLPVPPSRRR